MEAMETDQNDTETAKETNKSSTSGCTNPPTDNAASKPQDDQPSTSAAANLAAAYRKMQTTRRCLVFGCGQDKVRSPNLTFLGVPEDEKLFAKWMRLVGRRDWLGKRCLYHSTAVCELHFDPRDYFDLNCRKRLKKNSLPTRNLPIFKRKDSTDTTVDGASVTANRDIALENFHAICDKLLPKDIAEIVKSQTNLKIFDYTIWNYKPYKLFCLKLFHTAPQAYSMLKNALRLLPLKKMKNMKISVSSRLNDEMISLLKTKVSKMTAAEKNCAVIVGTIDVKRCLYYNITADRIVGFQEVEEKQSTQPANRVVVVLSQGIVSDWMQLLGYVLISDDTDNEVLSKWVNSVIRVLMETGLNVRAFVSSLEADFTRNSKKMCVDADDPFFFINDQKIYYFYDSLLLIQAAYKNLITYDFHFEKNRVAKFDHIIDFYWQDITKVVRQAENLTSQHIDPSNMENLTIKHAEDVLSKAVGTGISTHVSFKHIDQSGEDTADFILLINRLKETLKNNKFYGKTSQLSFLSRMVNLFYSLKLFDRNGENVEHVMFKEAFEITLRSTLLLMEDLKMEGYKCMKIPNHEAVRNLNEKILKKFGKLTSMKPTCQHFVTVFRSQYLLNAVKPIGSSRLADVKDSLLEFVDIVKEYNKIAEPVEPLIQTTTFKEVRQEDYANLRINPKDTLLTLSGYLLIKCVEYHPQCNELRQYLNYSKSSVTKTYYMYEGHIRSGAKYNKTVIRAIPPDQFVSYVRRLEEKLSDAFSQEYLRNPIAASIYEQTKNLKLSPLPCSCFPTSYLQKLFIRLRLFFIVQHNNIALRKNKEFSV